jgi:RNA polymerase sigma-54 factor
VRVVVPESAAHALRINAAYAALDARARDGGARRRGVRGTLELVREARQFIASLQRRYEVLRLVGEAVAAAQAEFVEKGPEYLRPLDKKAIAAQVRLHESTVCRATRGKFVQMPDGMVVSFDVFFDDALPLKCLVKYIIQREDKAQPVSDDVIAARLRAAGHVIARRTVAKYRAEMGIGARGERRLTP